MREFCRLRLKRPTPNAARRCPPFKISHTLFFWKAGERLNELLEPRSVKKKETEDEFVGRLQKPDIPAVLKQACLQNHSLELRNVVYYVGHGTIVPRDDTRGLAKWQDALYIAMERNSVHVSDFFRLPNDSVVLIGRQIVI